MSCVYVEHGLRDHAGPLPNINLAFKATTLLLVQFGTKREHVVMAPTEETLTMYRAAARAYRHTRRVLRAQPHECMWAAAGAVKALPPDLGDDDASQEAAKAIQWVSINYPDPPTRVFLPPMCYPRTIAQGPLMVNQDKQPLTDLLLRKLKSGEERVDVWDAKIPGFGVRISTSGTKSFILLYRFKGEGRRLTLGRYPISAKICLPAGIESDSSEAWLTNHL